MCSCHSKVKESYVKQAKREYKNVLIQGGKWAIRVTIVSASIKYIIWTNVPRYGDDNISI